MGAGLIQEVFLYLFNHEGYRQAKRRKNSQKEYRDWLAKGRPVPPPHIVKQMAIKEYAGKYKIGVFVETGTYLGEMVEAMAGTFTAVYSIELNREFLDKARRRLSRFANVTLLLGDSTVLLPQVLARVTAPCLFWLDGHYSGGNVKGEKNTPIMEELSAIMAHRVDGHVVLIDDAREFTGSNDYPTVEAVAARIASRRPELRVSVRDDIIRICKPE
ncbi:MAG TPA: hypothetical protein VLX68_04280 [Chitinivibrionales bacterium]|nr:hypothetical protein [Chitinivibrionales bacterium]